MQRKRSLTLWPTMHRISICECSCSWRGALYTRFWTSSSCRWSGCTTLGTHSCLQTSHLQTDLTRVLEQARLDAIADLSAVGIVIANVPPADDSNSDSDSDGDSDDAQLDMMHATAHLDDVPVDAAEVDVLHSLSDTDDTDDDNSDAPAAAVAVALPAPGSLPDVHACRLDQLVKVTASDMLLDRSGHPQHKQHA